MEQCRRHEFAFVNAYNASSDLSSPVNLLKRQWNTRVANYIVVRRVGDRGLV